MALPQRGGARHTQRDRESAQRETDERQATARAERVAGRGRPGEGRSQDREGRGQVLEGRSRRDADRGVGRADGVAATALGSDGARASNPEPSADHRAARRRARTALRDHSRVAEAVVLRELLGPPVALRRTQDDVPGLR